MNDTIRIGDQVTITNKSSSFFGDSGPVVRVTEGRLPYHVQLPEDTEEDATPFSLEELKKTED